MKSPLYCFLVYIVSGKSFLHVIISPHNYAIYLLSIWHVEMLFSPYSPQSLPVCVLCSCLCTRGRCTTEEYHAASSIILHFIFLYRYLFIFSAWMITACVCVSPCVSGALRGHRMLNILEIKLERVVLRSSARVAIVLTISSPSILVFETKLCFTLPGNSLI